MNSYTIRDLRLLAGHEDLSISFDNAGSLIFHDINNDESPPLTGYPHQDIPITEYSGVCFCLIESADGIVLQFRNQDDHDIDIHTFVRAIRHVLNNQLAPAV